MDEGEEVGYIRLEKDGTTLFWEASLLRHEITGDFKIRRKWKTRKQAMVPKQVKKWHETDWEIEGDQKFRWKIIQKITQQGYEVKEYRPFENNPSLEILKGLESQAK